MYRASNLLLILAIVMLGLGATVASTTAAQEGSAIPPDHSLIGTWRVTATEAGAEFPVVSTWSADGTYDNISPLVAAIAPDVVVFSTTSLGTWVATGDDSGAFTAIYFYSDDAGNLSTIVTSSGEQQVSDDGQTATGTFAYSVAAPDGTVIHFGEGTYVATRLTVVPIEDLATPVASPAA